MAEEFDAELLIELLQEARGDLEKAAELAEISVDEFEVLLKDNKVSLKQSGELGNCFMSSGRLLLQLHDRGITDIVLVHGFPVLTVPPYSEYAHSWIEIGDCCIDSESKFWARKSEYYFVGRIDPSRCVRYSPEDILKEMNSSGHWGPWDERFQEKE